MLKWWQVCPVAEAAMLPSAGYDRLHAFRIHRFIVTETRPLCSEPRKETNCFLLLNTSQLVIVRTDSFLFVWPLQKFQLALLMATPVYQIVKTFPLLKSLSANSRLRWSEGQTDMCIPCYKETVLTAWMSVLNRIWLWSLGMWLRVVWCVRTDVSKEHECEGSGYPKPRCLTTR